MIKNITITEIRELDRVNLNKPFFEFTVHFVPRIGELIYYDRKNYRVKDIIHYIDKGIVEVLVIYDKIIFADGK